MRAPAVAAAPPAGAGALGPFVARALELGRSVAGRTGTNPPVGCVLVRDGIVVGEGATAAVGGPHAEVAALAAAGTRARGATAVVTLEPCAHTGRTGPCTAALSAAGVAAVRFLVADPNPVAAGGAAALADAGLDVLDLGPVLPEAAARARHDLRGFLSVVAHGRPHVVLKLAQDVDGRTVPPPGGYLTGDSARRRVHALRADVDAVLVGGATVRSDDPRLDVRHVSSPRQPRPVVLTGTGDLPADARVLARAPLVVVGPAVPDARRAELARAGAEVRVVEGSEVGPDPVAALAAVAGAGLTTVLAEPGPRLAALLLAADLVDTVEVHVAGGAGVPADGIASVLPLPHPDLVAADVKVMGEDLLLRYVRSGGA